MKDLVFGIFAHPDDEAFGPSASLMQAVDNGSELHLICLTNGQAGINLDRHRDLGAVRRQEWEAAGELIGATGLYALCYEDGCLCHGLYSEIDAKISAIISRVLASQDEAVQLRFVTFDQNGITGHLDHIAASYICTKLFYCLANEPPVGVTVREIAYYCLPEDLLGTNGEWSHFYMPIGRPRAYLNRQVDVRALLPRKYAAMRAHKTQRQDAEALISRGDDALATDYFHVVENPAHSRG